MDVNQKINSFTPQELATFLNNLNGFDIDFSIKIKPKENEISRKQAADFLSVTIKTIDRATAKGLIKMVQKTNGRNVYYRDNLTSQRKLGLI